MKVDRLTRVTDLHARLRVGFEEARDLLVGCRVEITSTTYNGQPYGRSRKKFFGDRGAIKAVTWDEEAGFMVWLDQMDSGRLSPAFLALKDVRIVAAPEVSHG